MTFTVTQTMLDSFSNNEAKLQINGVDAVVNDVVVNGNTLTAISNSGFQFTPSTDVWPAPPAGAASVKYNRQTGPTQPLESHWFILQAPATTAVLNYTLTTTAGFLNSFTVSTEAVILPSTIITAGMLETFSNNNAKLQINGVDAVENDEVFQGDILTAVANEGWQFKPTTETFPVPPVDASSVRQVYVDPNAPTQPPVYEYFILQDPVTTATLETSGVFTGFEVITEQSAIIDTSGVNNVYLVDSDIMTTISIERFIDTGGGVNIDLGAYIINLLQLPFTIPEELVLLTEKIAMGDRELTTAEAPVISTDKIPFDMGSISIPAVNGNMLDYTGVVFNLHLPYTNSVNVEAQYLVGETLSIEYLIDVYTGEAQINLKSTKVDNEVFFSTQTTLGINIPYSGNDLVSTNVSNTNITLGGDNRILIPFIEEIRNEALLSDKFFTAPITDEDLLANQVGFVVVSEIELKTKTLSSEKEDILSLLKQGVIINE